MENHSFSSYPDSGNSSPRSREIDLDSSAWDEPPPANYKVRLMCSYGGKIHPRPHDNQLFYVGGDTKIVGVDRHIKFPAFMSRLASLCDSADLCVKYQLPGEDLDALISITNDEDLEHMMVEFDRLHRSSTKPARLRLFLFPLINPSNSTSFGNRDPKAEGQWFVDALNSVQIQSLEASSPQSAPDPPLGNPDFLFGFDKGIPAVQSAPEIGAKDITAGSDCGSEDRHVVGDPVMSPAEMQRQIQESQRMQVPPPVLHTRVDDGNTKVLTGDYYGQKVPEKVPLAATPPLPVQMPLQIPAGFMTTGSYAVSAGAGNSQPVYYIPAAAGTYMAPTLRPVTGNMGQAYYGVHAPPQPSSQQPNVGVFTAEAAAAAFPPMAYDNAGRHVYYTAQGGVMPGYHAALAVDGRQGGGALNQVQEGKMMGAKGPLNSSA